MTQSIDRYYLGVDVGSISTNLAVIDQSKELVESVYIRTEGKPVNSVQKGIKLMREKIDYDIEIAGAGSTGSARKLTGVIVGADIVKNEITAHALASLHYNPEIQTVMEIGGQDSKIIIIRNSIVVDFAMNTVCAAGTGSFLDMQASRLDIPIENFGSLALKSDNAVSIAGRCTVFAESDMIHKQQLGHPTEDIIKGLCEALARNYLNNVGKGKDIQTPIMFQGGVAANAGMREAFEKYLEQEIIIPEHYDVMGAIGAAILAQENNEKNILQEDSQFYGWDIPDMSFNTSGFECDGCPNICEIVEIRKNDKLIARWGSRCGKWDIAD
ncbi:MAG: 2-hydroxyglutaryl-CoA dehydratase [Candidatus Heimdallarchaeota archaeon]|nr:2-hydroxyglutaryl-CoA dehydratase [Candidatus Heimdallarchaeota archaeon]MCK4770231.1 2-hydroxyglutaryl-CoA dehydratase [Candidatus Heimdallarchaeota archaeon]